MSIDHRSAPMTKNAGVSATLLGFGCAGAWALLVGIGYFAHLSAHVPMLMAFAAATLGPIVLMLFSALAAREGARANARLDHIAALTETALLAPSPDLIEDTRELAAALRTEVEALDAVVHIAARRLDAFETGLRKDGGVLARALGEDIATIERARADLNAGTIAVGDAVARHVATLREGVAQAARANSEAALVLDEQIETFGAVSARIGARSAEFASAAAASSGVAGQLDAAVDKALAALAHATSLTDTARKSAEEAAMVAQEAAGAVRGATRSAVAEARDAAKRIRADAAGSPAVKSFFGGAPASSNVMPPAGAEVITMQRPARATAITPAIAPEPDLASIIAASGVGIDEALSAEALDHIAQAAREGPAARREAVRFAAPRALRHISAHLRRDAAARRDCEKLRREPRRALGAPTDSATRRRVLASAYLLIDAVLG